MKIISQNPKYVKKVLAKLKDKQLAYKYKKKIKKTVVYSLSIKDHKTYRNIRLRRSKKFYHRNQLYYRQFETYKKKRALKVREILVEKGFQRKHLLITRKLKKLPVFIITYNQAPDEIPDEAEEAEEEVETEYKLAQSKFKIEGHSGGKESYQASYLDILSGMEVEGKTFSGKLLLRVESFQESSRIDDYKNTLVDLDEVYINLEVGEGQFTLGRQLFSWGVFDEFSNLDRVNIKNLQRFVFDSGEAYRRPITAARLEYYIGDWKIDTYADFGFEKGKELDEQSLWSGINRETGIIRGADPTLLNPLLIKNVTTHFEGRGELGYGLRISHSGWADVSLSYLRAYADMPILELSSELRQQVLLNSVNAFGLQKGINIKYVQESAMGIDAAKTIGGQLYKFELTYIPDSLAINETLELKKMPKGRVALGGDLEFELFDSTLTWQLIVEQIISSEKTLLDKQLTQAVFQSSSRFMEDKLESGLRFVVNGNDQSYFVAPYANYDLTDSDTFGLNLYSFSGNSESFFGYHKDDYFMSLSYKRLF